jgi:hypothetical protein
MGCAGFPATIENPHGQGINSVLMQLFRILE